MEFRGGWPFRAAGIVVAAALFVAVLMMPGRSLVERVEDMALAGLAVVALVALVAITSRLQRQSRRTHAIAIAAQRVGLAIDTAQVVTAVLEAVHEVFPNANFGGILVFDPDSEKLVPTLVAMQGGLITATPETGFRMSPGEGLAGKVFLSGEPRLWGRREQIAAEHRSLQEGTREEIAIITGGLRSAAGAPLKLADRGVIGVLTLGSTAHDNVFRARDLVVLQGLAEQAALGLERARMYQEQRAQAMTDPLTGLANYRQMKHVITQEVARARRSEGTMAVIFSDLDDFKLVNDRHGHRAGDAVLKLMARAMLDELRTEDLAARYGGDEFVCVLPGADLVQAKQVMERIANRFRDLVAADEDLRDIQTAPSSGCAVYPDHGTTAEDVLAAADAALMSAKKLVPDPGH